MIVFSNNKDNEKYLQALEFASKAHAGMHRKGNEIAYIIHPVEVAEIIATVTTKIDVICAGLLHDVVEDTPYTIEDIQKMFGPRVAVLVSHETENKRPERPASETWRIRKEEFLNMLPLFPEDAQTVVLADKISNMRALARDYSIIGDAVFERFNQKDKKEHAWYYGSIIEILSDELAYTDAWQELEELYNCVFEG